MFDYTCTAVVLGGLTIEVEASIAEAEPDVGLAAGVEDWSVSAVKTRGGAWRTKRGPRDFRWIEHRVASDRKEHDRLCEAIMEARSQERSERSNRYAYGY